MTQIFTPKERYINRRQLLKEATVSAALLASGTWMLKSCSAAETSSEAFTTKTQRYAVGPVKSFELTPGHPNDIGGEFENTPDLSVLTKYPNLRWNVGVSGLVERPFSFNANSLAQKSTLENRICSVRCTSGWRADIPVTGIPLSQIIEQALPQASARYVQFHTYFDASTFRGGPNYDYLELAEAMHRRTFLATRVYDEPLFFNSVRLVVPWKYGVKSLGMIASIEFIAENPRSLREEQSLGKAPRHFNVNPSDNYVRDQSTHFNLTTQRWEPTPPYNGHEDEVGHLYR